jgi:predicted nucleic acid-binding Zn ribbon protein
VSSSEGGEPTPLREGLERYFRHLGVPPVDVVSELTNRWADIVGPALAEPTRPRDLVDGVLTVVCDDAAWASQIGWMEAQIKQRFAAIFPEYEVVKVVTRTARA